jgi:hypothetical protein
LQFATRSRQALLEVLHHVETIDGDDHVVAEHFPRRGHIGIPHVGGYFFHLRQQALVLGPGQVGHHRGFFAVCQHLQHTAVIMIDDYGDELAMLFFNDNSSMPIRRIG